MKNRSLGMKILMAVVTLGVLVYFGFQAARYFGDPLTTTLAYTYQVEEKLSLSGYVVREEQVLPDDDGLLRLQRSEGERVSKGGIVATAYADQASLDRQNEIDALEARIEQLEYAQEAALGADVSMKLDDQILRDLLAVRSALAADRLVEAGEQGKELRSLVLKRDYTDADTENLESQIETLEAQLKTLKSQAASSTRRITAPASGLYSAVVDGYETVLTPERLKDLTPSDLGTVKSNDSVRSQVGKLILGDSWYYAAVMDAGKAKELEESGSLVLRFSKSADRDLKVTVDSIGPEENGKVVVTFRGTTYLAELTMLRQQSAEIIRRSVSGIRVPTEALRAEKVTVDKEGNRTVTEGTGVYCVVGMEARFKPVKVLYSGDGFVLVKADTETEKIRLRSGDEIILTANDLYDGKVVG